MPAGLHYESVIVTTPQREMKFTAANKERHDLWFSVRPFLPGRDPLTVGTLTLYSSLPSLQALQYLLARPNPGGVASDVRPGPFDTSTPRQHQRVSTEPGSSSWASPRSLRSSSSRSGFSTTSIPFSLTPKAKKSSSALSAVFSGSMSKRTGTPAQDYLAQLEQDQLRSPEKKMVPRPSRRQDHDDRMADENAHDDDDDDDFEHIGNDDADEDEGEGYEGLENVRACCNGDHDLSSTSSPPLPSPVPTPSLCLPSATD